MIWAIASVLILSILAAGILSLSQRYASRSLRLTAQRQTEVTARSAVEAIVSTINGYPYTAPDAEPPSPAHPLIPPTGATPLETPDIQASIAFPAEMGTCSAVIVRLSESRLQITATAALGDAQSAVVAYCLAAEVDDPELGPVTIWSIESYEKG